MSEILREPASREELPPWLWPRGAYVHVPFCAHHCGYCDFAVVAGRDNLVELYLDALALELTSLGQPQPVQTIFVGGGTPTHLNVAQLNRLLTDIRHWLLLSGESGEFSIEANPDSLTAEKIAVLADHGVTRISLGAQSFHPHLLHVLERPHNPDEIGRAFDRIRSRIPQVSLDLIFGIPGQTQAEWREELERALALGPDHVSTYGLTFEKGTPLWKKRERGELRSLDEELELDFYATGIDVLESAGFEHYEVSNFARPGSRCRHNEIYWANEAHFGFGLGAARYVHGQRDLNTRDLDAYIRKAMSGDACTFQSEKLEPFERARETMAIQLRRADGIDRPGFLMQTGYELESAASPQLVQLLEQGFLADNARSVRLTRKGFYVADAIIERLLR